MQDSEKEDSFPTYRIRITTINSILSHMKVPSKKKVDKFETEPKHLCKMLVKK